MQGFTDKVNEIYNTIRTFILGLNPFYVSIAAWVFLILTVVLFTIWIVQLSSNEIIRKKFRTAYNKNIDAITDSMKISKAKVFNYNEIKVYMSRTGIDYMARGKLTPLSYVLIRVVFALFCMAIFATFSTGIMSVILAVAGGVVGYLGVDWLINFNNKADNQAMLEDIKGIYDTLRIQTKAGVYITQVLTDCYLVVQNRRLKKAFLELTSDLAAKNDTDESLDKFKNKFSNNYLDTLVIIVKQSMQTGQAAKMFEDIRVQISDIENAMMEAEQQRVRSQITFVQILLYVAIIAVTFFIAITGLSYSFI